MLKDKSSGMLKDKGSAMLNVRGGQIKLSRFPARAESHMG